MTKKLKLEIHDQLQFDVEAALNVGLFKNIPWYVKIALNTSRPSK